MIIIAICVVVALLGVWLLTRKKSSLPDDPTIMTGIPVGKEELFEIGTHPAEDGIPVMYTLTTCRHCVHLKDFLDAHSITFHIVYVDDFENLARATIMEVLRANNPRGSFPTFIVPGGTVVVGFREPQIRAALGLPVQD